MTTTDITQLAQRARAATDAIVAMSPEGTGNCGRSYADLAAELRRVVGAAPTAVTQAAALIDITAGDTLTEEMHDVASLTASALFLGRRLFDSNATQILEGHPELAALLAPVLELAGVLGTSSDQLAAALRSSEQQETRAA